jgi:hypothetical protein
MSTKTYEIDGYAIRFKMDHTGDREHFEGKHGETEGSPMVTLYKTIEKARVATELCGAGDEIVRVTGTLTATVVPR